MTEETLNISQTQDFHNDNRRIYERFPSRFPLKFKDSRCDFGTDVVLCNLSAEGVNITTRERLYLNDSVSLEVELLDGKGPMPLRGQVVWNKERDADLWDVGIKFHKIVFMDLWRIYGAVEYNSTA